MIELKVLLYFASQESGVSFDNILGNRRKPEFVRARYLFFYFAKEYANLSFETIGAFLNRDHSTVSHGLKTLKNDIENNYKNTKSLFDEIQIKLNIWMSLSSLNNINQSQF